ncbi:PREDICTED: protodermal factor 1-like [Nicotiana attenuata]|uniref:Protodermal factor 1 n=1 Tax=Nicotiana attenuata TaxID=49451 RepID=A0A314KKY1_NICAT|nr:PREDICTED: protodermal factor 1-like [Nicotiana attenuata]OIT29842.1 protodermal factor 1 [Nicotiana attenuata]
MKTSEHLHHMAQEAARERHPLKEAVAMEERLPSGGGRHNPSPPPPSGGRGGGHYPSPPTFRGTPPSTPTTPIPPTTPIIGTGTPSTPDVSIPSPPFDPNSPPSRGGYYPSPPTYGGTPPSIPTPSTPSTPTIVTPPTTPIIGLGTPSIPGISTPSAPFDPYSPPSGSYNYPSPPIFGGGPPSFPTPSTPGFPTILTPPTSPIINPGIPTTPGIYIPPPLFDPNSPPFPLDYWRTNPALIWGLFGWWATVGSAFGVASTPGFGGNLNLLQALSNPRADGVGELYREGTASLLNSMVSKNFAYSTKQVRDSFVAALSSDKAAAAQARIFKLTNEGRLKPKA